MASAVLALEAGDYFNFSRFADVFVDVYKLAQTPDHPALQRLTEVLMVVRDPFALLPDYPEFLGLYERLLRRVF